MRHKVISLVVAVFLVCGMALGQAIVTPVWANDLTGPEKNAVRSAKRHLDYKGWSRAGLIDQLSSEYGGGYPRAVAITAVDSLNIDWYEQAARAAQRYVDYKGWSCRNLKEQLSSEHGAQFTSDQAAYGARQTNACQ